MKIKIKSKGFLLNYMESNGYTKDTINGYDEGSGGVYVGYEMLDMAGATVDAEYLGQQDMYAYRSHKSDWYDGWNWPEWAAEVVSED